mmetsp:Transcript_27331/g.51679  ORF Transcript_27331/g.51679 Transcript_27331/m.51679 type:complete len:163 (-) Transcript_27331:793-1281(-)|eukprot:CAMPEP_0114233038 /NCGR_PEP_ID=MMETSP0058-20121206/4940_1 /TAXON_ID=36894 /ORGANISM="Pyramimonas parkeae, CCMP726" /LENGTH=162 /DNA_ID=CAMNT_0001344579 /DNA_START=337 /DNA_END=825 /DNA_ORIENTATION=-
MATEDPDQISDIQSRMMSVHIEHQRAPHRLRVKALNPFKTSIRLHARHDHIREYRGCCAMDAHFSTAQAEQARKGAEDIAKEALKLAEMPSAMEEAVIECALACDLAASVANKAAMKLAGDYIDFQFVAQVAEACANAAASAQRAAWKLREAFSFDQSIDDE